MQPRRRSGRKRVEVEEDEEEDEDEESDDDVAHFARGMKRRRERGTHGKGTDSTDSVALTHTTHSGAGLTARQRSMHGVVGGVAPPARAAPAVPQVSRDRALWLLVHHF